jgi:hypothetical protein
MFPERDSAHATLPGFRRAGQLRQLSYCGRSEWTPALMSRSAVVSWRDHGAAAGSPLLTAIRRGAAAEISEADLVDRGAVE